MWGRTYVHESPSLGEVGYILFGGYYLLFHAMYTSCILPRCPPSFPSACSMWCVGHIRLQLKGNTILDMVMGNTILDMVMDSLALYLMYLDVFLFLAHGFSYDPWFGPMVFSFPMVLERS